jgi:hypothetical protein
MKTLSDTDLDLIRGGVTNKCATNVALQSAFGVAAGAVLGSGRGWIGRAVGAGTLGTLGALNALGGPQCAD